MPPSAMCCTTGYSSGPGEHARGTPRPGAAFSRGRTRPRVGGIDVLEYSPVGRSDSTVLTTPADTEPSHVQHEIEFQLYGAITTTKAVLAARREAGAGTPLYTTGAGSIDPVPQVGNVNAAAAALRNWVINLQKELAGIGIQAAHVGIDVSIGTSAVPGFPTAQPEEIDLPRLLVPAHHQARPGRTRLPPLMYTSSQVTP